MSADGEAVITLTVTPTEEAPDVAAIITHGDGIASEATREGDRWTLTVSPPGVAGEARVEVRIDGVLVDTVDTYSASYSSQVEISSVEGLTDSAHTMTIDFVGAGPSAQRNPVVLVDAIETRSLIG